MTMTSNDSDWAIMLATSIARSQKPEAETWRPPDVSRETAVWEKGALFHVKHTRHRNECISIISRYRSPGRWHRGYLQRRHAPEADRVLGQRRAVPPPQ